MTDKPTYEELAQRVRELEIAESEGKWAEEALRKSEERLNLALTGTGAGLWDWDMVNDIVHYSPLWKTMLGYQDNEIENTFAGWKKLWHPDDASRIEAVLDGYLKGKIDEYEIEYRLRHKDGNWRWILTRGDILKDTSGKPYRWVGTNLEITRIKETEQALRESEERYKTIVSSMSDLIFVIDEEDRFVDVHCKIPGTLMLPPEDFLGKTMAEVMPPQINEMYRTSAICVRKSGENLRYEYPLPMQGKTRWYRAFLGMHGDGRRIVAVVEDITERKDAEQALRESQQRHRTILENIADGYYEVDLAGNLTFFNDSVCELLGYSRDELMGMNNRQYTDEHGAAELFRTFNEVYRTGRQTKGFGWEVIRKDQTSRFVEASVTLMKDAEGKPSGFRGIVRDITERKRAEEALQAAEETYRNIFLNSQVGLFRTDMSTGLLLDANDAVARFFGYEDRDELLAEPFSIAERYVHPGDRRKMLSILETHGEFRDFEAHFRKKDGSHVLHQYSGRIVPDKGWIEGVSEDITEHKQAEEEREKLQAQLAQAQKMESIGTLAGGIAHNFNNVLMGIQGRASLMMMDKDSAHPDYEHLKGIEEYVRTAAELTRDLLGFARGGKYEVTPIDLNGLISHESRMFGRTRKEIRVHEKYEKALWTVEADPGQMRQVFLNLYVNAWHAMPGGGDLYIQTENATRGEVYAKPFAINPGRYVKVSVTDTGMGMDDATLEKVFDPFFSTKDTGQGSGLGLASVYGIIKNHGGFIDVYSEKGTGSTFNIYLPASEKEAVEDDGITKRQEMHYGRGTVLLVDDEDMTVDVGQEMLERLGYQVLIAKSGWEALDIYKSREKEIDLVILDMIMPGLGGGETYDRLKEIDGDVRVLLSSGYSINGQAKEIMDRGCGGFLQKPFAMEELSRKVKEALDQ